MLFGRISLGFSKQHKRSKRGYLSDKDYKSLRKLLFLWIKTLVHYRFRAAANFVLVSSIGLNAYLSYSFLSYRSTSTSASQEKSDKMIDLYSLDSIPSVSSPNSSLKKRFDILYRDYLKDKQSPDYSYYNKTDSRIDQWWYNNCITKLRRIVSIRARIRDIERCINASLGEEDTMSDIVKEKRYEEILSDMSNYYSKFVSIDVYQNINRTMD